MHDAVRRAATRGVLIAVTGAALTGCIGMNEFDKGSGPKGDSVTSAQAREVLLQGLGVGAFADACDRIDWACPITEVVAESDYVVTIRSSVSDSRWEPAGRGARSALKYLRQSQPMSRVTTVKYTNAKGNVLDTADRLTSSIGDCPLPCGSPR
ncbi:hypothetical protein NDR87_10795 [Nocardia sp. CDC159]|uniref:Uncharacterized protein n=1 Tax=Nocardia pulmonis TaxID=2951408 RepID=A0A9X2E6C6_9NOCA|nr:MULTISPECIES: hypothetical protein [Nocardia]MCM6773958.1 hypothetical protein [Nocardia pulmonis]MCM6786845.1 hypothetical protein [Nocardia sp. CDC159]